jgi:hypothetical protein
MLMNSIKKLTNFSQRHFMRGDKRQCESTSTECFFHKSKFVDLF